MQPTMQPNSGVQRLVHRRRRVLLHALRDVVGDIHDEARRRMADDRVACLRTIPERPVRLPSDWDPGRSPHPNLGWIVTRADDSPRTSDRRLDVLIQAKEVCVVVSVLERDESLIVRAIGRPHAFRALVRA